MRPKIYVTRQIPEAAMEILQQHGECRVWPEADFPVPREVLLEEVKQADGLFSLLTDQIDEPLLAAAPHLKVAANMAVGYDNIDLSAARKRGIVVTNTPGILNETTADLTFALLLATARRLIEAADFLKNGQWKTWSPMLLAGVDVYGATLGIIGMGRIGEAVARRAKGFNMRLLYHNRNRKPAVEQALDIRYAELDELLQKSDFVVLLTPLTPDTRHLIGARELSLMKPTAILINTARGPVVDTHALYEALLQKKIWAAGLDVFEAEPVAATHPLLALQNVVALPHIGSSSIATRTQMAVMAAKNLVAVLTGQEPPDRVV